MSKENNDLKTPVGGGYMKAITNLQNTIKGLHLPKFEISNFKMPNPKDMYLAQSSVNDYLSNMPEIEPIETPFNNGQFDKALENIAEQNELLKNIIVQGENNYIRLNNLYDAKVKEAEDNKIAYEKSKKYNQTMMWVAIGSGIIGFGSLIATILIGVL